MRSWPPRSMPRCDSSRPRPTLIVAVKWRYILPPCIHFSCTLSHRIQSRSPARTRTQRQRRLQRARSSRQHRHTKEFSAAEAVPDSAETSIEALARARKSAQAHEGLFSMKNSGVIKSRLPPVSEEPTTPVRIPLFTYVSALAQTGDVLHTCCTLTVAQHHRNDARPRQFAWVTLATIGALPGHSIQRRLSRSARWAVDTAMRTTRACAADPLLPVPIRRKELHGRAVSRWVWSLCRTVMRWSISSWVL